MDNETTVPSVLMARDYDLKPIEPSTSHILMKIGMGIVVLLLLVLIYKR